MLGLFGLNFVMNGKMFSFDGFSGFRKSFCGIKVSFGVLKGLLKSLFY